MLKQKQTGVVFPKGAAAAPSANVVNLMDALWRSIASEKKPAAKAKKRAQGQSEMLLPISGKKVKEESPWHDPSVSSARLASDGVGLGRASPPEHRSNTPVRDGLLSQRQTDN
jgi:hypothetical protein